MKCVLYVICCGHGVSSQQQKPQLRYLPNARFLSLYITSHLCWALNPERHTFTLPSEPHHQPECLWLLNHVSGSFSIHSFLLKVAHFLLQFLFLNLLAAVFLGVCLSTRAGQESQQLILSILSSAGLGFRDRISAYFGRRKRSKEAVCKAEQIQTSLF